MGTRNLTMVISEGETKIAQYGQWDGYPTGVGVSIVKFLEGLDIYKFKETLKYIKEVNEEEVEAYLKELGCDNGWMNQEQSAKFYSKFPGINRNLGADILFKIYNGEITEIRLSEDFKDDHLYCEYYYTINLDDETISVNDGKKYPFKDWTIDLMEKLEEEDEDE